MIKIFLILQADSYVSPSLELDPSFAFIRGSIRDLRHYQVLGAIDKVILVLDKNTDETFVIKVIMFLSFHMCVYSWNDFSLFLIYIYILDLSWIF